jgi:enoyl-CoA hydratase/carnithine racemase
MLLSLRRLSSQSGAFIKKSVEGKVALLELDRPGALNSLNAELIAELIANLNNLEADEGISAAVITGSSKTFAGN